MGFKQVLLLQGLIFGLCFGVPLRVYYSRCGADGFSCVAVGAKHRIAYTCPATAKEVTFYLWQFRAPTTIESLVISNCTTLQLSFECTGDRKDLTQLHVANITNLFLIKTTFTANPRTVTFENIDSLEYIPENSFSQIRSKTYRPGCTIPAVDLADLHFLRVNIGVIASRAFKDLKNFHNFTWDEVHVQRVEHAAIELNFDKNGTFLMRNSNLEISEHVAFRITGVRASFIDNKFVDISAGAISGTIESFTFDMNNVNTMQAYGISILSQFVRINHNRFEYLRAGALEKISPGLLQDSGKNFGTLKFIYEFRRNHVNFMDAGSLNPDMRAYDNVATEIMFTSNLLFCSCENLGWLVSDIGHGFGTALLDRFYSVVINENYNNTCAYTTCQLTLKRAKGLVENGKCEENRTAEQLCIAERRTTTTSTRYTFSSAGPTLNASQMTFMSVGSKNSVMNYHILVLMIIFRYVCKTV